MKKSSFVFGACFAFGVLCVLGFSLNQLEVPPGTTDGQVLTYYGPANVWYPKTPNGGATTTPTAMQFVVSGTTNQVVFGGTNTAPASNTIVKWISVQVAGETNAYRIGLAW